jgi:hypothetical protein
MDCRKLRRFITEGSLLQRPVSNVLASVVRLGRQVKGQRRQRRQRRQRGQREQRGQRGQQIVSPDYETETTSL